MTATPCLYGDLRVALATLYSLPHQHHSLSSHDAHNFLMEFQARNVRRKLQSIHQRQVDLAKRGGDLEVPDGEVETISFGSSWLACLMVLMQSDTHSSERLFCAQTLMHRLRRSKMNEAIDIEIESQPGIYHEDATMIAYQTWIHVCHAPLGQLIARHLETSKALPPSNLILDEERIKCEISLLTLAFLAYHHSLHFDEHTTPLLTTLGGAMAAIALRLRYTPQSMAQNVPATSTPMVQMILHSLQSVAPPSHDISLCACACLGAIPETILASPGGATGRLSIDPRCVVAAYEELRSPTTGVYPMWQALSGTNNTIALLWTFERWARYLPLPWETFVEPSLKCVQLNMGHPSAMAYLVAIFEAAAKRPEQILSFALALDPHNPQSAKKRQSSKSKKRQKEMLEEASTDERRNDSIAEFQHRGDIACKTAAVVWNDLQPIILSTPEGVSCLCACANVCLPHWIRHPPGESHDLIQSIMASFQDLCMHPSRDVRGQTYEPLCNLHLAMQGVEHSPLEPLIIDHLFRSTMHLANSCGYPADYFEYMSQDSDDELEIERNDVRDVLRAVCGGEDACSGPPKSFSLRVLDAIVRTCTESIMNHHDSIGLPYETAVHALSALAKPLILLAESFVRNELSTPESIESLSVACRGLSYLAVTLIDALPKVSVSRIFPLPRLLNLGFASLCPAFSTLCQHSQGLTAEMNETIRNVMQAAVSSVIHIPELAVESTLENSQFDIRGAFCSPGGEDHAGILVFVRLAGEGDELAAHVIRLGHEHGGTLLMDLCRLHNDLKGIEKERGPMIHHGKGVTPRTRRILLETISRLSTAGKSAPGLIEESGMQAEKQLQELFESAVFSISTCSSQTMDAATLFQICEDTYDIASFSSSMVSQLFAVSSEPLVAECVSAIIRAGMYGYERPLISDEPDVALVQWGRFRGAITAIIKASADPDLSQNALEALVALTKAECSAIVEQCHAGASSHSSIFNEQVVSSEKLPAGAFLIVIAQVLADKKEIPFGYLQALAECSSHVLRALIHECPKPSNSSVMDARPALCEAWFLAVSSLTDPAKSVEQVDGAVSTRNKIIADTCCAAIVLILYPSLETDPTKRADDLGMSMDGAQTLAAMEFFEKAFELGPEQLHQIAHELQSRLQVELQDCHDTTLKGMAIIGAGLFRAAAGGLPPWAVECIPSTYAALYHGCGNDAQVFSQVLYASMKIRLAPTSSTFGGGVTPGTLLAGRFFQSMREPLKEEFLAKAVEIAAQDSVEGWRRFKTLLKQASGGKKKASGFNLKPSPTSWECDRL